jgi:pectinesterase
MKKSLGTIPLLLCFLWLSSIPEGFARQSDAYIRVRNPLTMDRMREMVIVRWNDVRKLMPRANPATIGVRNGATGKEVAVQAIDMNQDGAVDELIFLADLKAGETKSFVLQEGTYPRTPSGSMTDARFVPPREDLAWENDRIAFRMYGPPLAKEGSNNGIDVWTKRVRSLIVENWYRGEEQRPAISYHEDHGEGADYFTVGSSLGAGAVALLKDNSLYQPGVFEKHRVIATGPLQAMFELTYKPVVYDGKKITEIMRVTLTAGSNLNKIEVTFLSGSNRGIVTFAAGLVKRKGAITYRDRKNGWTSLWGLTTDSKEVGYLGTGIVMPSATMKEMKEDSVHALIVGRAELGKSFTYYAGAGWTRSGDFATAEDWNNYLSEFAQETRSPLILRISKE